MGQPYKRFNLVLAIERSFEKLGMAFMRGDHPFTHDGPVAPIAGFAGRFAVIALKDHLVAGLAGTEGQPRVGFAIEDPEQPEMSQAEIAALESREHDPASRWYVACVGSRTVGLQGSCIEAIGDARIRGLVLCREVRRLLSEWPDGDWFLELQRGLPVEMVEEAFYRERGSDGLCPCESGREYRNCHPERRE